MLSDFAKKDLERQQYRIVGSHSAVKVCGWTKNMLRGQGGCYKLKFYGINSTQCMQMTTSLSCANRCVFCWRGYKAPVSTDWKWSVDDPIFIMADSIKYHHKLLAGFGGNDEVTKKLYSESKNVKHVALSLTGEPITYPRINELLDEFNKKGISTFIVTNAQHPESIKTLNKVTQLYLSIDAPNKELLKKIDAPLFDDYWDRMLKSLDNCKEREDRTCIRLTIIKNINNVEPENYATLIDRGMPDFVEIKGYMHIGASRNRLERKNMPRHKEVVEFTKKILKYLDNYEIVADHLPSRVAMIARKEFKKNDKWFTWIDFDKWNLFVNNKDTNKKFSKMNYLKETPIVGITTLAEDNIDEMNIQ